MACPPSLTPKSLTAHVHLGSSALPREWQVTLSFTSRRVSSCYELFLDVSKRSKAQFTQPDKSQLFSCFQDPHVSSTPYWELHSYAALVNVWMIGGGRTVPKDAEKFIFHPVHKKSDAPGFHISVFQSLWGLRNASQTQRCGLHKTCWAYYWWQAWRESKTMHAKLHYLSDNDGVALSEWDVFAHLVISKGLHSAVFPLVSHGNHGEYLHLCA